MIKKAIRMKLYPGCKEEYERRHKELWPEMRELLKNHGAENYLIFLDSETNLLFGYLEIANDKQWELVGKSKINRKWWDYMSDIMETNSDNSPITTELEQVFML